ncbi:MAG: Spore coat domain protein [Polaromonas sp.]|jgi:spore coat protein U-like protein|nr:Spore coat domain protein [Polaromonas sp.]
MQHALLIYPAAALLIALAAGQAHAACTVGSSGLAFGPYQPLTFAGKRNSADVTSTASVSVNCDLVNGLLGYTLKLGPSPAGNSISPRYMGNPSGGANMVFNVYTNATYSTIWGDGSTGSIISRGALNGNSVLTVYGKIPAGQNTLRAGSFSSALTVTLTFNV